MLPTARNESGQKRARLACAVWILVLLPSCSRDSTDVPPADESCNVLLISVDTLRADRLNCYGFSERVTSPNIDALAADGILFEHPVAASPWTTPSHMSMLTSLYPTAHGLTQPFDDLMSNMLRGGTFNKLPESRTTLAETMKQAGFATAAFTAGAAVDPRIGFGQGFDSYGTSMYKLDDQNMTELFTWIDTHNDRPFFLFWHNFEVHAPYLETAFLKDVLPPEQAAAISRDMESLSTGPTESEDDARHRIRSRQLQVNLLRRHQAFTGEVCDALYQSCIRSMDEWLGRTMQHLRQTGLYDRTLIIFTSDHGEEFAEHQPGKIYGEHGHTLYDEMVRVPLIVKLPRQAHAGTRISAPVSSVDIVPTMLDVMNIRANLESQGRSLRSTWTKADGMEMNFAISESLSGWDEMKSLRLGSYKYILSVDGAAVREHGRDYIPDPPARAELYNLEEDPGETQNLLLGRDAERHAERARTMEAYLRAHVSAGEGETDDMNLDAQTLDDLKALGYIK